MPKFENIKDIQVLDMGEFGGERYAKVAVSYEDLTGEVIYINVRNITKAWNEIKIAILNTVENTLEFIKENKDIIPTA